MATTKHSVYCDCGPCWGRNTTPPATRVRQHHYTNGTAPRPKPQPVDLDTAIKRLAEHLNAR